MPTSFELPRTPGDVYVTPEMAAAWLQECNDFPNRRFNPAKAERWRKLMAAGQWLETPEPIIFDTNGKILNGQHRLAAVVSSGVTIKFWVHPGASPRIFPALDSGDRRQAGEVIFPGQAKYAGLVAGGARVLSAVHTYHAERRIVGDRGVYNRSMEVREVLAIVSAWPELERYAPMVELCYRHARINKPMHLALAAMASRTAFEGALEPWFDGMAEGADLGTYDARRHLRNRYLKDAVLLGSSARRPKAWGLLAKAWNAYATGKEVRSLNWKASEGVVLLAGWPTP